MHLLSSTLLPLLLLLPASLSLATNPPSVPLSHGLTGFGTVPSNIRDKYDDTLSFGSAIALEPGSWKKHKKRHSKQTYYTGTLWMLPDRGWNTNGTTAYQVRVHKFGIRFSPLDKGEKEVQKENLEFIYKDTVLLRDPKGDPVTGLDPDRSLTFSSKKPGRTSFPPLPAATVQGNGFGGPGNGATNPIRVCLDPEGLALSLDKRGELTGFYISDEYGPYVYRFSATTGIMDVAIRPPSYYIPQRNGADSFASNNPPIFAPDQVPEPEDPSSGRNNNQGFEGMTVVRGEGRGGDERLYVLLQSALMQDGGEEKYTNRYTRLLEYEVSSSSQTKNKSPVLKGEYVVPLPTYYDPSKKPTANPRTAAQSAILSVPNTPGSFLILSRDGDAGRGQESSTSLYRGIDLFTLDKTTTNLQSLPEKERFTIATSPKSGVLKEGITPAKYKSFININEQSQLSKFGLHNGGEQDRLLLNEKWEGLALLPVDPEDESEGRGKGKGREYFLLAVSDNDFITQDGYFDFGRKQYSDGSGGELEGQGLVWRVRL